MDVLLVFNRLGVLPTFNFRAGSDPSAERLSAERLHGSAKTIRASCADCMIACERRVVDASGIATRLEYENAYALGPLLGNWDMDLVLRASRRCDELGLDTITSEATLGIAAECVERGLLDLPELARRPGEFLIEALNKIARRDGYGALLALRSRALALRIGQGCESFAPHVKGLELPGYHPAALQTLALGLAVGSRGADHNKSSAYDLDLSGDVDRFALDAERVSAMVELENQAAVMDSLILCKFVRRAVGHLYAEGAAMLSALTGWPIAPDEVRRAACRIHDLKKIFNQRQGWSTAEDTLPARFFSEAPADSGAGGAPRGEAPPAIDPGQFQTAKLRYYERRGWGRDGTLPANAEILRDLRLT